MFLRVLISLTFIISISTGNAQHFYRNVFEFNVEVGYTNDLSSSLDYSSRIITDNFIVDDRSPSRVRNYNFAFTRYVNPKNGFQLSYGNTRYEFNFKGRFEQAGGSSSDNYSVRYREIGFSYVRIISGTSFGSYIVKPGVLFLGAANSESRLLDILAKTACSFSLYSGYEFPMLGDQLFTSIGLQVKLPLMAHNRVSTNFPQKKFYPFYIGFKLGFSFQNIPILRNQKVGSKN